MSAETAAPVAPDPAVGDRRSRWSRFVTGVLRQTLVDPVDTGRLRNVAWPYGLTAVVAAGYAMFALAALPVPVAVAVAMFQRRLYDVQLAANRTLTYLTLSAVLAGVYALVVVGVGVMLQNTDASWLPLAGTAVVAVASAN